MIVTARSTPIRDGRQPRPSGLSSCVSSLVDACSSIVPPPLTSMLVDAAGARDPASEGALIGALVVISGVVVTIGSLTAAPADLTEVVGAYLGWLLLDPPDVTCQAPTGPGPGTPAPPRARAGSAPTGGGAATRAP